MIRKQQRPHGVVVNSNSSGNGLETKRGPGQLVNRPVSRQIGQGQMGAVPLPALRGAAAVVSKQAAAMIFVCGESSDANPHRQVPRAAVAVAEMS